MQKTLVTGAAGALGRLGATYLKEASYQVHVMSRRSVSGPLLPDATWVQADGDSHYAQPEQTHTSLKRSGRKSH